LEPLKLSITQIVEITHECRAVVFDAIAAGDLRTFLVGRRRFARPAEVAKWVDYLERESDNGRPVAYRREATATSTSTAANNLRASKAAVAARRRGGRKAPA
jgi:hypothetical protein